MCEIWKSVASLLVHPGHVAWRTVRSLLRRLVWPGAPRSPGLLELPYADYGPDWPPVGCSGLRRLPDGRYRLRYRRYGIMRTAAEVYPARQAAEAALCAISKDG